MPLDAMFTFEAVDLVMMAGHELAKKAKIRITRESPYECTLNALKTLKKQVGFCHFWLIRWNGHPWTMNMMFPRNSMHAGREPGNDCLGARKAQSCIGM